MSVYIKGFPLPNNCGACPLRLAWCRERIYMVTRPERCPLVPVPPHGDLIDRDVLKENCMKEDSFLAELLFRKVSNAPTIIPAEPAEEGET